jgi:dTDP-4-amino-4,6-dideoxygalactose transaminase
MDRIKALAEQYHFSIIEDASHAIGSSYKGFRVGSGQWSDLTVLSFHPVKIITAGEGGMVLTNRDDLYQQLLLLRSHGITRDPARMQEPSHGPWYYEQIDLGFNYRITDIHAALGASQLKRIDRFVGRRNELAQRYDRLLQDLPLTLPWQDLAGFSSFHLYIVRLHLDRIAKTHRQVFEEMRAAGIQVNLHYMPVHLQPYYRKMGFKQGDFPEAEQYYREAITLPLYYGLSNEDQDRVVSTLAGILA